MPFTTKIVGRDYTARTPGFLLIRVTATPDSDTTRFVKVECTVDDEIVASASAADNRGDVISSPTQTTTVPIARGSTYRVDRAGDGNVEIRWTTI